VSVVETTVASLFCMHCLAHWIRALVQGARCWGQALGGSIPTTVPGDSSMTRATQTHPPVCSPAPGHPDMQANGIPVPRHIIVSRDMGAGGEAGPEPDGFVEGDDWVELNGVRIEKPFVEKPVSGEDHNIWIFYPSHMVRGGRVAGCAEHRVCWGCGDMQGGPGTATWQQWVPDVMRPPWQCSCRTARQVVPSHTTTPGT
jgi:hypothetical protein